MKADWTKIIIKYISHYILERTGEEMKFDEETDSFQDKTGVIQVLPSGTLISDWKSTSGNCNVSCEKLKIALKLLNEGNVVKILNARPGTPLVLDDSFLQVRIAPIVGKEEMEE